MTEQTLPKRRLPRRSWPTIVALVIVVALVAVGIVVGVAVRNSLRSGVRAGTLIQVDDNLSFAGRGIRTGTVLLPSGALKVEMSPPETHFATDADPWGADKPDRVEKSGRWMGVGWTLGPLSLGQPELLVLGRKPVQFRVVLVADGTRYDLGANLTEDASAATDSRAGLFIAGRKLTLIDHKRVYVALPKAPRTTSLEVSYDGLTQRFSPATKGVDRGAAVPLYRTTSAYPAVRPSSDRQRAMTLTAPGFGWLPDSKDQVGYGVRPVTPLPYVPGLGWAKAGRSWLVVPISTNIVDPFVFWPTPEAARHALYVLKLRSTAVTLDGRRPTLELPYYQQNPAATASTSSAYYIWDVPAAGARQSVRLHQVYVSGAPDEQSPPSAPKQATAAADITMTITR